jgi:ribose transport system ATP-binding protein
VTTDDAPALIASHVAKTFGRTRVLTDLNLQIRAGEIHALVGENGSGKSTFIKILSGFHSPDSGAELRVAGIELKHGSADASYERGCRFVHQDLGLIDELSVVDNLHLVTGFPTRFGTILQRRLHAEALRDLGRVGLSVDPAAKVGSLSPAMKTGVAVARALRPDLEHPPQLLVLDEATATMPDDEVARLHTIVRQVASMGIGVLYVTHRLDEVFTLSDRVTVLRDGQKVTTQKTSDLDRVELVTLLIGSELDDVREAADESHERSGRKRLEVHGLRCKPIQNFAMVATEGSITGIAGLTGSGRETILAAIFGAIEREGGVVSVDGVVVSPSRPRRAVRSGMAYLPPDRKTLGGLQGLTARENLSLLNLRPFWILGVLRRKREQREVETWFERLEVRPKDGVERPLATFSGGNQQKILFAKWMRVSPSVYLLDEPTQGVDVGAKALLHRQLLDVAASGGTVVMSSSDVDELAAICDRVIVMQDGLIERELPRTQLSASTIARAILERTDHAGRSTSELETGQII